MLPSPADNSIEVTFYVQDQAGLANSYDLLLSVQHEAQINISNVALTTAAATDYGVRQNCHGFMSCKAITYVSRYSLLSDSSSIFLSLFLPPAL